MKVNLAPGLINEGSNYTTRVAQRIDLDDAISFTTGIATISNTYSIQQDGAGSPNHLQLNVPSGKGFKFSIAADEELIWTTGAFAFQQATTLSTTEDVLTIDGYAGITLQTTGSGNVTVAEILDITDATDSSDATGDTGALRTEGGASIAKKLYVGTDLDVDGTTNLDVVDIDGAVQLDSTFTIGVDDTGYDVKFFGATAAAYMLWDQADNSLILNMGPDNDEVLELRSSDVTHGVTGQAHTNTFGLFRKTQDGGGLRIDCFDGTADRSLMVLAVSGGTNTTKSSSADAPIALLSMLKSGTSVTSVASNGNLLVVGDGGTMRFIIDVEGDLHAPNATISTTGMDDKDDVALVRSLDHLNSEAGVGGFIRKKWDQYVRYNEQDLIEAKILGDTIENEGFINITGMQRLHSGAIWQLFEDMMSVAEALPDEARQKLSPRIQKALEGA